MTTRRLIALAAATALLLSAALNLLLHGGLFPREWAKAWMLTLTFSVIILWTNAIAVGAGKFRFLGVVLGAHAARLFGIGALVIHAGRGGMPDFYPFFTAVFADYFVLMAGEMAALVRRTGGADKRKDNAQEHGGGTDH